jgi:hypothetical protein
MAETASDGSFRNSRVCERCCRTRDAAADLVKALPAG